MIIEPEEKPRMFSGDADPVKKEFSGYADPVKKETVSEEPSLFSLAIERKINRAYMEGYQEGMHVVFLAFVMACIMTIVLRRLFDGTI